MKLHLLYLMLIMPIHAQHFVLITSLYNEQHPQRILEYIQCLRNNIKHPDIAEIHVVYDTKKDNPDAPKNIIHKFLMEASKKHKINIHYLDRRPTYGELFEIANSFLPTTKVIISNADIYFNDTLSLLIPYDFTNKFLALTRWNVQKDGTLKKYYTKSGKPSDYSQDSWMFVAPLVKFDNDKIPLGIPTCDGKIAYQARQAGLKVINPCLSIQCCHLHLTAIRDYSISPTTFPSPRMKVTWEYLHKKIDKDQSINKVAMNVSCRELFEHNCCLLK